MLKLTLAFVAIASAAAHDFKICSGVTDHFKLTDVTLNPDPVVAGKTLNVSFTGTPDQAVASGKAALVVKLYGVKIASLDFDVCTQMGFNCPIAAGSSATGFISYSIPSVAPKGISVTVELTVKDGSGAEITCVDIDAKIGSPAETTGNLRAVAPKSADEIFDKESLEYLFDAWTAEHSKSFMMHDEFVRRFSIFSDNLKKIYDHNQKGTYQMAMNQFGHLTAEEFKAQHLGYKAPEDPVLIPRTFFTFPWSRKSELSSSVDWVSKGAVTDPKNQGSCGGCWAFSTTGSIEGAYFIKTGTLVSFSEQQLVSCDSTDEGCNGGLMDNAFKWVEKNGGLCTESDYPYTSSSGTAPSCASTCTVVSGSAPTTYTDVDATESALMAAVSKQPVSIAIEADQSAFQFYSSGVLTGTCGTNLDHGVLVVGYGTDNGTDYWKVKNSWGSSWGQGGYIMLERGNSQSGGQCGILMKASYPTL